MADAFELLSGSTNGLGVKIAATATPGTTVHTAVTGTTDFDLVTLWATNNDADGETRTLTLEWGTATALDGNIVTPIPCKAGAVMLCDRLPLRNGLTIAGFADEANDVLVFGFVTRIDK